MNEFFRKFAQKTSHAAGSPGAFLLAMAAIVVWLVTGPIFKFGDTWQLVINTGTTIVTFLMVFLIQNTQNRDSKAMHLKLDELIRSNSDARNALIDLEDLKDDEVEEIQMAFQRLHDSDNENIRDFAKGLKDHLDGRGNAKTDEAEDESQGDG